MLEMKNVCKIFSKGTPNEHVALKDLTLVLKKGDFVTVVGSNGAGKSTLFHAICGNFWLDGGSVFLDGEEITFLSEHHRARVIGRVFQDPMKGTAPHMTIEENLALAYSRTKRGMLGKACNRKDVQKFREALEEFGMGLENRMQAKVGLLSGGQRQVVTLLMCTLVPPKLLLLDEHTAALDPATAERVMEITKRVVEKYGLTTMMITHNLSSALETGNRTIMMDAGEVILDVAGEKRKEMTLEDLLKMYSLKRQQVFDNDRMLLQ